MKCRNAVNNNIVWFGRIPNPEYNPEQEESESNPKGLPAENYVGEKDGVVVSLQQHLSVLKGELWYQINYGLPLVDKYSSKAVFDTIILNIISENPGVNSVRSFTSDVKNHTYTFSCIINTIYNEDITISNSYT